MLGRYKKPAQLNEQPEKILFDQDTTTLQKDFFYRLVRIRQSSPLINMAAKFIDDRVGIVLLLLG